VIFWIGKPSAQKPRPVKAAETMVIGIKVGMLPRQDQARRNAARG